MEFDAPDCSQEFDDTKHVKRTRRLDGHNLFTSFTLQFLNHLKPGNAKQNMAEAEALWRDRTEKQATFWNNLAEGKAKGTGYILFTTAYRCGESGTPQEKTASLARKWHSLPENLKAWWKSHSVSSRPKLGEAPDSPEGPF